jgi:hypothetical protein
VSRSWSGLKESIRANKARPTVTNCTADPRPKSRRLSACHIPLPDKCCFGRQPCPSLRALAAAKTDQAKARSDNLKQKAAAKAVTTGGNFNEESNSVLRLAISPMANANYYHKVGNLCKSGYASGF